MGVSSSTTTGAASAPAQNKSNNSNVPRQVDNRSFTGPGMSSDANATIPSKSTSSSVPASTTFPAKDDPLTPHIARDLPHHIVESRLVPGSGRMMRTYRIRHADTGAVLVLKAMIVRLDSNSASSQSKGHPGMTPADLAHQEAELQRLKHLLSNPRSHPNILPYSTWFLSPHSTTLATAAAATNASTSTPTTATAPQSAVASAPTVALARNSNNSHASTVVAQQPIYLLRPHTYSTLSDRMATRPFLTSTEKMFVAFQLLSALASLHETPLDENGRFCCHGHVTCENIGITSYNWIVLMDVASYKPVRIPDDDPSDWIDYFQEHLEGEDGKKGGGGGEKKCYLAPERFYTKRFGATGDSAASGTNKVATERANLTPAMDIFSLGCVLMELFLNGERALDLGDLMEYRKSVAIASVSSTSTLSPSLQQKLNKIESASMRAACRHMLNLDPVKRLSAREYLNLLSCHDDSLPTTMKSVAPVDDDDLADTIERLEKAEMSVSVTKTPENTPPIPPCFQSVLFPLLKRVRCEIMSPDARIALAASNYARVLKETVGVEDKRGEQYFTRIVGHAICELDQPTGSKGIYDDCGTIPSRTDNDDSSANAAVDMVAGQDGLSKEVIGDRKRTCYLDKEQATRDKLLEETEQLLQSIEMSSLLAGHAKFSAVTTTAAKLNEKETKHEKRIGLINDDYWNECVYSSDDAMSNVEQRFSASALIILVQFIISSIRHVQRPSSKLVAIQLLLRLANFSGDEVRLQRIVPTIVSLLNDADSTVRASAISVLTALLCMIQQFPPSDALIFPQYIFKRVSHLISDQALIVRVAFAQSVGLLAETALRFFDTCHAIKLYETVDEERGSSSTEGDSKTRVGHSQLPGDYVFDDDVADLLGGNDGGSMMTPTKKETEARSHDLKKNKAVDVTAEATNSRTATVLIRNTYDKDLATLRDTISRWVVHITTDTSDHSSPIKQAFLTDITRLCNFFGHEGVMACVLPQVLAFLNDRKDWQLRAALCEHLPSICATVGRAATEQFVVPCVETALVDGENQAMCSALNCLTALVEMGLLTRASLIGTVCTSSAGRSGSEAAPRMTNVAPSIGLIEKYAPLYIYPSADIRYAACAFFAASCRAMKFPDDELFLFPLVRPFMRCDLSRSRSKTTAGVLSRLIPPLTKKRCAQIMEELRKYSQPTNPSSVLSENTEKNSGSFVATTSMSMGPKSLGVIDSQPILADRQDDDYYARLQEYLWMLSKNTKYKQDGGLDAGDTKMKIDGASKCTFSCYVPNQACAEMMTQPLPDWYVTMRHVSASEKSLSSEATSLRSVSSLFKVYGLTVEQSANTIQPQPKASFAMYDALLDPAIPIEDDGTITTSNAKRFLTGSDSRIFDAALHGEWGALARLDPVLVETSLHVTKLKGLRVPTIPPRFGEFRKYGGKRFPLNSSSYDSSGDGTRRVEWKPKTDVLVASSSFLGEHAGPVTRLAVSQDQTFFVSASHDGTSRVWELSQFQDSVGDMRSSLTYSGHKNEQSFTPVARINDVAIIENSHSVATAGSDGAVHIWRVEMVASKGPTSHFRSDATTRLDSSPPSYEASRVSGNSLIREVDPQEGEVFNVSHFNTNSSSVVAFATKKGSIHSWDLRSEREPFLLRTRPEMGYLTGMSVGTDRNWLVAGTNRGYVALWDLRFQKMVKLWQHSSGAPITRLATSFTTLPQDSESKPYVILGCGLNETAIFDVSRATCCQCFRVLDSGLSYLDQSALPTSCLSLPHLNEVRISSSCQRKVYGISNAVGRIINDRCFPPEPTVQSFTGRIGANGPNYLITGDSVGFIRYWDFSLPSKCYTVSGLRNSQPRPRYESVDVGESHALYLCRQMPTPELGEIESSKTPKRMNYGLVRPDNYHRDAILDLKKIDFPMRGLLSCSRDGTIKLWR